MNLKIVYDFSRPECVGVFNSKEVVEEKVQLGEVPHLFSFVGWQTKSENRVGPHHKGPGETHQCV